MRENTLGRFVPFFIYFSYLLASFGAIACANAAEITISCGSVGIEYDLCESASQTWAKKTGHTVNIIKAPSSSPTRLSLYQTLLAAKSSDVDILTIDMTWPGIIGSHLLNLNTYFDAEKRQVFFKKLIENNTLEGDVKAVPWFVDAGLLYYRKDLLKKYNQSVPKTWDQLTKTAIKIQNLERNAGRKNFWGLVFQGKANESLTCNALEWITSFGVSNIVTDFGELLVTHPDAIQALSLARSWVGGISPRGVLSYTEEESRAVFQTGNALFMRNWPYAWALLNASDSAVKDKVGLALLPKGNVLGGRHSSVLGGWSLAVSKYSKAKEPAIDLVLYLTSEQEQKRRAQVAGLNPTIKNLYRQTDLTSKYEYMKDLSAALDNAVLRPNRVAKVKYNRVSVEFYNSVHNILSGKTPARPAMSKLEKKLLEISEAGRW